MPPKSKEDIGTLPSNGCSPGSDASQTMCPLPAEAVLRWASKDRMYPSSTSRFPPVIVPGVPPVPPPASQAACAPSIVDNRRALLLLPLSLSTVFCWLIVVDCFVKVGECRCHGLGAATVDNTPPTASLSRRLLVHLLFVKRTATAPTGAARQQRRPTNRGWLDGTRLAVI